MFYSIAGTLVTTEPNAAIVDNNGIAYRMTVSFTTLGKLSGKQGERVLLYTHLNVREDGLDLFGFYTQEELETFKMLTSVSGVGPKAAMSILSGMSPEKFAVAVGTGDAKAISKAPGVGAKTAARIILELKDKIAKQLSGAEAGAALSDDIPAAGDKAGEAVNALLVLGYTRGEATAALKGLGAELTLEEMITAALKKLMKG